MDSPSQSSQVATPRRGAVRTLTTVAAFYAEHGSLSVNGGPPAVGRQAIAPVARGFRSAFPNMKVTMDDFVRQTPRTVRNSVPLDANGNEHWTRRYRKARSN